ncbi:multiple RNA-binding domain-containing 1 [Hyphodiscus hymeniophilus]|uniref:Multiple RNA-binding domain-containing protein 1 n=1 Tax=Hyphodiscus hymeniophilus TaxID=353542 RepID=A0A9P7B029_9HELO|nr:multiple RNA-binding domain-containing 1 [Hyphodiscus hymeniophilus]
MLSSRIFIKGLPPTITEDEFKKHFGAKFEITDAKLISQRRIGYVGYKSPEDAANAVKYFNRSYIRMSKVAVEIARPISDASLPVSRKQQREQERENVKARLKVQEDTSKQLDGGLKRKRSDVDKADSKLKEFLEVMQPASKSKKWASGAASDSIIEPPTKIQAIEIPEAESDEEYEAAPKKQKQQSAPKPTVPFIAPPILANEAALVDEVVAVSTAPDATDDDWLRGRTNRLLDLMDPEDISTGANGLTRAAEMMETAMEEPIPMDDVPIADEVKEEANLEKPDPVTEAIQTTGRLFVRNLPYTASEDELRKHFEPFGGLEEVHLPVDSAGTSKGFVLVQYTDPAAAAEAYHNLDGEPFQGRLLHILPGTAKREKRLDEFAIAKLPLKKQKQIKKKADASSTTFNWNSLFMNQDAVNSSIAGRLGLSKHEMLDPTSADAGVKQAIAETTVIQETKSYFARNGVDLDAFKGKARGDTTILVKNFSHGMTLEELRKMFEEFGQVLRVLMPPTGTIAIVEFAQSTHARAAFASLAYRRIKDSVLFLEKAPKDLFASVSRNVDAAVAPSDINGQTSTDPKLSSSDLLDREEVPETSTLFVRNLNFTTTSDRLTEVFKPLKGFMSARVNTKTDTKKPGQVLSMGFGFLEFVSMSHAQAALKAMNDYELDGHKLLIKASHKGLDAAEERKKDDRNKKMAGRRTKIIIKNLPFEATKKDLQALFGSYGQLRSLRIPKKFDHSTRGFAFADFITAREAENALEALKDTHLLGRRLVLEFAAADPLDAEEEIEKMEKKTRSQVDKVALQKLTGVSRKKFNIVENEGHEN